MTAILAMNLGDRVVMLTDTACLSAKDNTIAFFGPKMIEIPAAQSVIAITGLGFLELFLDSLAKEGRSFISADDLWTRLPSELRAFHQSHRHLYPRNDLLEHGGVDNFTVVVATGGDRPRIGRMDGPYGREQVGLIEPWELKDSKDFPLGRPERWLIMTGFGSAQLPDAFVAQARLCSALLETHGVLPFDTGTAGVAYFEAVREHPFPGGCHAVGGQLEEWSLGRSGEITKAMLRSWPEDRQGFPITPRSSRELAIHGHSQNLADLGNLRAAFDNLHLAGVDIVSAGTLDLEASTGIFVEVTGTTTTTAITLSDGHQRLVRAAAAWPLTHGTNLQIQGGASYTCTAGDLLLIQADGTVIRVTVFKVDGKAVVPTSVVAGTGITVDNTDPTAPVVSGVAFTGDSGSGGTKGMVPAPAAGDTAASRFLNADGTWQAAVPDGAVVNSWLAAYTAVSTATAIIPADDTVPTSTEGLQVLSITTGTLKAATNKLRVRFAGAIGASTIGFVIASIYAGTTNLRTAVAVPSAGSRPQSIACEAEFTPGSTDSQTITVRVGSQAGNLDLNGVAGTRYFGGAQALTLVVEEIKA